jgi:MoaA/NifB/PqqE/SkfB family radical SAM enzyme
MSKETIDQVIRFLEKSNIHTLDLTGGVPEMNPHFKYLVSVARKMDIKIID